VNRAPFEDLSAPPSIWGGIPTLFTLSTLTHPSKTAKFLALSPCSFFLLASPEEKKNNSIQR
jgi:hypothetical protein